MRAFWALPLASAGHAEADPASLDRLHDLVVPAPVSWWPVAPGWIGVGAALVALVVWLILRGRADRRRNRYRGEALAELASLRSAPLEEQRAASRMIVVLKRTALTAYPREELAGLSGEAWWRYLDARAPKARFVDGVGAALEARAYGGGAPATAELPIEAVIQAVESWIRDHRPIRSKEPVGEGSPPRRPTAVLGRT